MLILSCEFLYSAGLLSRYKLVKPKSKFTASQSSEYSDYTIDDCARSCNDQLGLECKSFDFCYLTGQCRLRESLLSENSTEVMDDQNCDIYESKFSASYY